MKREDATTLAGLLREAAQQGLVPSLTYQGAEPLSGFHGWADGKPNLAVVQLDREDAQYRLLVSDWQKTGEEFYLVIYRDVGTRGRGPLIEWRELRDGKLWWTYSPRKRDSRNIDRVRAFRERVGSDTVGIDFPSQLEEIPSFILQVMRLVETRRDVELVFRKLDDDQDTSNYLSRLLPDADQRTDVLEILGDAIEWAEETNPDSWILSPRKKRLRLNVGRLPILTVFDKDLVRLAVLPAAQELGDALSRLVARTGFFKTLPDVIDLEMSKSELVERWDELKEHARSAIQASGEHRTSWLSAHDSTLLGEISETIGRELPTKGGTPPERTTGAWMFQANPDRFDIRGALEELDELTWQANQNAKDMHQGDVVYIWESGPAGGLLAVATLISEPEESPDDEDERKFWKDATDPSKPSLRVRLRIDNCLDEAIPKQRMREHPRLAELPIFRFANATNFRITESQRIDLDRLIGGGSDAPRYWLLATGKGGSLWDEFSSDGLVRIGFGRDIGDIGGLGREDIEARLESDERQRYNDIRALHDFAGVMNVGDRIIAKRGRRDVMGYGIVRSDYYYDADREDDMRHTREVSWSAIGDWVIPDELGMLPMKTLTELSPDSSVLKYILQSLEPPTPPEPPGTYSIQQAMDGLFIEQKQLEAILAALRTRRNVILQGPPGVGKTFIARRLAYALMEEVDPNRVGFVQFHQSMTYEDFVQGWRPEEGGGFKRKNGLFYEFARRAAADANRPYVFIIDEINRGNLSKIFGELMLLIEHDKRGVDFQIPLTYSHSPTEKFFIPDNLYLLGMMNTADRSLAMVDYALRRRFRFFTLRPRFTSPQYREFLKRQGVDSALVDSIVRKLGALNSEIEADKKNLGWGYEIGHSFFCPVTGGAYDSDWFAAIVEAEILPLLTEYWIDRPEKAEEWGRKLLSP